MAGILDLEVKEPSEAVQSVLPEAKVEESKEPKAEVTEVAEAKVEEQKDPEAKEQVAAKETNTEEPKVEPKVDSPPKGLKDLTKEELEQSQPHKGCLDLQRDRKSKVKQY